MRRESEAESTRSGVIIAFAGAVVIGVQLMVVWSVPGMLRNQILLDIDSYMWMNRVMQLVEGGDWFNHLNPRIGPPEGHEQHWTRPLDAILLAGGTVLGWVVGFGRGLYLWGVALPPLLQLLTLGILVWAARPLLKERLVTGAGIPLLVLVFVAQVPLYHAFLAGRPDHHALLALLFVAFLGFWLRVLLRDTDATGAAIGLGLVGAASIWVNVEALIFVVVGMVGLGLSWFLGNRGIAGRNAVHGVALFVGIGVALLAEWGFRDFPVRAMDTVSFAHVTLFGLTAAFWMVLWIVSDRSVSRTLGGRFAVAGLAAAAVLGVLAIAFPEFYGSPLADVEDLYRETRLAHLHEMQPVHTIGEGLLGGIGALLLYVGAGLVALPYLVFRFVRSKSREERILWLTLGVLVAVYLFMSVPERRWTDYLALSALLPYTVLVVDALKRVEARFEGRRLRVLRPAVMGGLVLGPGLLGLALIASAEPAGLFDSPGAEIAQAWSASAMEPTIPPDSDERLEDMGACNLAAVSEYLRDRRWFPEPVLIMAQTDYGPELMYRTSHSVLSIPNHRPQPGFGFTHAVMSHSDPGEAAEMLRRRGVGAVLLCRVDVDGGFFHYPEVEEPFSIWLARGGLPEGYVLHLDTPQVRVYRAAP